MPRIRVEVIQGQPFASFDIAARSLARAVTAYLAGIDEQDVKRVETHSHWNGERWLFLAFAWLREEEEEKEEESGDGSGLHQCPYCYNLVNEEHEEFCRLNPERNPYYA